MLTQCNVLTKQLILHSQTVQTIEAVFAANIFWNARFEVCCLSPASNR